MLIVFLFLILFGLKLAAIELVYLFGPLVAVPFILSCYFIARHLEPSAKR